MNGVPVLNMKPMHLAMAAGAVVLAYVWLRGARGAASDVSSGLVNAAGGLVEGLGLGLGIPTTDTAKCAAAQASGDMLGQSFYCTAPDFLGDLLGTAGRGTKEAVFTAGEWLGVPRTDASRCEAAKAAGATWDASKYCPAGDFLSWWVN